MGCRSLSLAPRKRCFVYGLHSPSRRASVIESAVTERNHGAAHVRPPPGGGASHLRLDDPDRQPMLSAVTRPKGNDSVSEARPFRATLSTIEGPAIHEGSLVPAKAIVPHV